MACRQLPVASTSEVPGFLLPEQIMVQYVLYTLNGHFYAWEQVADRVEYRLCIDGWGPGEPP